MDFISNIISNSVAGFVEASTRTAADYAGDALIRAGDLIENNGRSAGTSIERTASSYGDKLKGQGTVATTKANLPKTKAISGSKTSGAKKPTPQRAYSSPASTQPKKTAATTKKGPGTASKLESNVSTAKPAATKNRSPYPGTSGYPLKTNMSKPKPYPGTTTYPSNMDTSKPKPYPGTTTYPSQRDASKPKPYPKATSSKTNGSDPKPYPGTNTLPDSGKRIAVKPKPPAPYKPPAKAGEYTHIRLSGQV